MHGMQNEVLAAPKAAHWNLRVLYTRIRESAVQGRAPPILLPYRAYVRYKVAESWFVLLRSRCTSVPDTPGGYSAMRNAALPNMANDVRGRKRERGKEEREAYLTVCAGVFLPGQDQAQ
jgi:hypothetical protein